MRQYTCIQGHVLDVGPQYHVLRVVSAVLGTGDVVEVFRDFTSSAFVSARMPLEPAGTGIGAPAFDMLVSG